MTPEVGPAKLRPVYARPLGWLALGVVSVVIALAVDAGIFAAVDLRVDKSEDAGVPDAREPLTPAEFKEKIKVSGYSEGTTQLRSPEIDDGNGGVLSSDYTLTVMGRLVVTGKCATLVLDPNKQGPLLSYDRHHGPGCP